MIQRSTVTAPIAIPAGPQAGRLTPSAVPREHGAWGILLVPLAMAAGLAGRFDPQLRIKRLGWTEVAFSLLFLVLQTATLRPEVSAP